MASTASRSAAIQSAIKNFPPLSALSYRQNACEVFFGNKVDPKDYASFTFSTEFKKIYGEPTLYYSDFYHLMKTSFNEKLFPKFGMSFLKFATTITLLHFCNQVDQIALRLCLPVPGRREMEAGWAQYLVGRYSVEAESDIPVLIKEKSSIQTEDGARNFLQTILKKAIEKVSELMSSF
jgi:hypothetical protein